MSAGRIVLTFIRGAFVPFVSSAAVMASGLAIITVCAAVGLVLYGLADLFAFAFGIGFRWGLVIACWLLLVVPPVGALVHDWRTHRRLALPKSSPTREQ